MSAEDAASLAAAFQNPDTQNAVSSAFAKSLAASLDRIDEDDITIKGIVVKRRLEGRGLTDTQDAGLEVSYEIKYDSAGTSVDEIANEVSEVNTAAVSAALSMELQAVDGIDAVIIEMETPEPPSAPTGTTSPPSASLNAQLGYAWCART